MTYYKIKVVVMLIVINFLLYYFLLKVWQLLLHFQQKVIFLPHIFLAYPCLWYDSITNY